MKRFGGREAPKQEQFELITITPDGDQKVYTFQLTPVLPAGNVVAIMDALKNAPEESAGAIATLLKRVLDDRDGVPAKWSVDDLPEVPPKTKPEDVVYTGPDGNTYTMADDAAVDKFLDPANGSSRRRWIELMDPDNEEGVQLHDLIDIAEWVMSLSTDRPTPARASSTRPRKTRR